MAKENLPHLTEAQVRKLASSQSFDRGNSYYRSGAILESVRQGTTLRAQCEGSEDEPYEVCVTLEQYGISDLSCTCPYEWGGACKHQIALLLTYVHEPQTFRVIPPLETLLAKSSKETLIALIGEMVQLEPRLMAVVELAMAMPKRQRSKAGAPIDASAYRRQAFSAG